MSSCSQRRITATKLGFPVPLFIQIYIPTWTGYCSLSASSMSRKTCSYFNIKTVHQKDQSQTMDFNQDDYVAH
ncbi:hypothetical protein HHUSO_G636 [Huso huso]|uniref:Uncharacterized protein n=1 Tax=Huso huso TaxID=61971 RepID=A0ABR1AAQ4_HUSHU